MLHWQRGSLSPDQLDLVFRFLPLDLSFADENDILVFWHGDTYKACDARYIGRDIRDCHPENTLELLEEVLREFKAGTRDVAAGWQPKGERFKLTRYFAVRDDSGTYKGILEVNQEVADIRALEGEQELPGW